MTGHVIISHGLQSSPEASKATAIARVAAALGWSFEIPDYRDLDAVGELGDVQARIERLHRLTGGHDALVLAGSSNSLRMRSAAATSPLQLALRCALAPAAGFCDAACSRAFKCRFSSATRVFAVPVSDAAGMSASADCA